MAGTVMVKKDVWKHSSRVAWRKVNDEAVILDVETAVYYSLADAGLRMWELIGEGKTPAEIAQTLSEEYDAGEDELRGDCASLIARLSKEGLVERA